MQAPGTVTTQQGQGESGLGKGTSKNAGGSNQGKVGNGAHRRYAAHPRKRGQ
jgi:hypothetical protein